MTIIEESGVAILLSGKSLDGTTFILRLREIIIITEDAPLKRH